MTTRTPLELWERLVEEAGEELIERAASVSVAQAEKELRAVGFDVEAERAEGEAFLADLERPTAKMRRDEAFSACTNGLYSRCADLLDQAEQLDPAGESEPRVVEARAKIAAAQHPPTPQPKPLAPQPNPEEKPLK